MIMRSVGAAYLFLWQDDLDGVGVVGAGDGVRQDADGADHIRRAHDLLREVRGIADDHLGARGLALAFDADCDARVVVHDLRVGLVQHVRATVDGTQPRERLRRLRVTQNGRFRRYAGVAAAEQTNTETLQKYTSLHSQPCPCNSNSIPAGIDLRRCTKQQPCR